MTENPILSNYHPQDNTYAAGYICDCTNRKCNEEIYSNSGFKYNDEFYCGTHCVGEHLVNEGHAVDMSVEGEE